MLMVKREITKIEGNSKETSLMVLLTLLGEGVVKRLKQHGNHQRQQGKTSQAKSTGSFSRLSRLLVRQREVV